MTVIKVGGLHDGSTAKTIPELIAAWREEADRMWNYPMHNEQSISATFRSCADDLERLSRAIDPSAGARSSGKQSGGQHHD